MLVWVLIVKIGVTGRRMAMEAHCHLLAFLALGWTAITLSFCCWQMYENVGFLLGTRFIYIASAVLIAIYLCAYQEWAKASNPGSGTFQ